MDKNCDGWNSASLCSRCFDCKKDFEVQCTPDSFRIRLLDKKNKEIFSVPEKGMAFAGIECCECGKTERIIRVEYTTRSPRNFDALRTSSGKLVSKFWMSSSSSAGEE